MRLRRSDVLSPILVVLWSLAQGFPGPACSSERSNAQDIAGHLKNCIEDVNKLLLKEGYNAGEKRSSICLSRSSEASDGATQLGTISTQLCCYNTCLSHLANSVWVTRHLPHNITLAMDRCQVRLSSLRNTIKKMKMPLAAPYPSDCKVDWPSDSTMWHEIAIGSHLFKEFLEYLKRLQFPCG